MVDVQQSASALTQIHLNKKIANLAGDLSTSLLTYTGVLSVGHNSASHGFAAFDRL
jgi:hypothetical protein